MSDYTLKRIYRYTHSLWMRWWHRTMATVAIVVVVVAVLLSFSIASSSVVRSRDSHMSIGYYVRAYKRIRTACTTAYGTVKFKELFLLLLFVSYTQYFGVVRRRLCGLRFNKYIKLLCVCVECLQHTHRGLHCASVFVHSIVLSHIVDRNFGLHLLQWLHRTATAAPRNSSTQNEDG